MTVQLCVQRDEHETVHRVSSSAVVKTSLY